MTVDWAKFFYQEQKYNMEIKENPRNLNWDGEKAIENWHYRRGTAATSNILLPRNFNSHPFHIYEFYESTCNSLNVNLYAIAKLYFVYTVEFLMAKKHPTTFFPPVLCDFLYSSAFISPIIHAIDMELIQSTQFYYYVCFWLSKKVISKRRECRTWFLRHVVKVSKTR